MMAIMALFVMNRVPDQVDGNLSGNYIVDNGGDFDLVSLLDCQV